jgi:acetyl esterase
LTDETTKEGIHMSETITRSRVVLEPASQEFVEATSKPPFLYELTPNEARKVLDDVQAEPIDKLAVLERWITVPAEVGDVRVRIVRPPDAVGTLPVILYMHGGGWVLGNADTHDRLVRELAIGTGAAVAFVEYDRSPEAHYPVAIEQGYATARWIVREGAANQLDPNRMAVAGDSVGGGMTAALALMAGERGDVRFVQQSMYYPVTDAGMNTGSYEQFAEGYFLTAKSMAWFWDAYLPEVDRRSEPYASPLRASDEQLAGLPPAFLIVDEADVLRDEGEAYAGRLRAAGVAVTTVRYDGITHDFMMLNPLSGTHATRAAVAQAIAFLRGALHGASRTAAGGTVTDDPEAAPSSTTPGFNDMDLDELRRIGHEVSFGPGEVVFEAGDRAEAMFVVLEGEAQVDVGGRFHRLLHGDVFGEMALLSPDRRLATVRAVEPVRALRIEGDALLSLLRERPEVGVALLRTLVLRLREVEQRIDAWMAP